MPPKPTSLGDIDQPAVSDKKKKKRRLMATNPDEANPGDAVVRQSSVPSLPDIHAPLRRGGDVSIGPSAPDGEHPSKDGQPKKNRRSSMTDAAAHPGGAATSRTSGGKSQRKQKASRMEEDTAMTPRPPKVANQSNFTTSSAATASTVPQGSNNKHQHHGKKKPVIQEDDRPHEATNPPPPPEPSPPTEKGNKPAAVDKTQNRLMAKMKSVIAAPHVYKDLMASKADMVALSSFAVQCSSESNPRSLMSVIKDHILSMFPGKSIAVFIVPLPGSSTVLSLSDENSTAEVDVLTSKHPLSRAAKRSAEIFDNQSMYVAFMIDKVLFGGVCVNDVAQSEVDEALQRTLQAVAGIAAMSMRTFRQVSNLELQNRRSEQMLQITNQINKDNFIDEARLIPSVMSKARDLLDAERAWFFPAVSSETLHPTEASSSSEFSQTQRRLRRSLSIVTLDDAHNTTPPDFFPNHVQECAKSKQTIRESIHDVSAASQRGRTTTLDEEVTASSGLRVESVMCLPVEVDGQLLGVAQLINKNCLHFLDQPVDQTFTEEDCRTFSTLVHFLGVAIRNCRSNQTILKEKKKTEALFNVAKHLSACDIRDIDTVVAHVMKGAKELLGADRSSLFLIDEERNELYSKVASGSGGQEIRFPCGKGIAGTVAATGTAENIRDAYTDERFNRDIDKQMGYRTQSILAEPISYKGDILAVAQLVNKVDPDSNGAILPFTEQDEETFRSFSLFAGIALKNSRLLEFTVKASEEAMNLQSNFGNSHLLSLSTSPRNNGKRKSVALTSVERSAVLTCTIPDELMANLTSSEFNMWAIREHFQGDENANKTSLDAATLIAVRLFQSTGLMEEFDCDTDTLVNFVIRCRGKYRQVPYHNFYHAVDVLQTIHTFLYEGGAATILTKLDCFVLMVSALVHDLDHMGLNNNYHLRTDSPLGMLSAASGNTSVLEVHHCNLAIEILQEPSANVFRGIQSNDDVAHAYRSLIDCVLATDMARHDATLKTYEVMFIEEKEPFVATNAEHRKLVMQLLLEAADISNVSKPFEVSRLWAAAVTDEFYKQGDQEKEKGLDVAPMFDRAKGGELAKGQIDFIKFRCLRFFGVFADGPLIGLKFTLDRVIENMNTWQTILDSPKN